MKDKKLFFERPTPAQIKEGKEPLLLENKIVAALQELPPNQYAVIPESIFDPRFINPAHFLKHGRTLALRSSYVFGKTPHALFKEAVNDTFMKAVNDAQKNLNPYVSGYSFKPLAGPDRVPRRVPYIELLEAARIMAYSSAYPGANIIVEGEYTDAAKARTEGGSFLVSTPSRTRKHNRYRFKISSIPVHYSKPYVYLIPYGFASWELGVESKAFRELRFTSMGSSEASRIDYIQAHEIAAAYAVAETQMKKGNPLPLRFSVFPAVSQQAVDLYLKLMNRTLLQVSGDNKNNKNNGDNKDNKDYRDNEDKDNEKNKDKKIQHRHLTQAHIEAIMWGLVRRQGYAAGFDDNALLENKISTYNWDNQSKA